MFNQIAVHDVFEELLEESEAAAPPRVDDTETSTTEPELDDSEQTMARSETSRKGPRLRRIAAGIAALLFVGATAAAGFFGWQVKQQHDIDAAARAASAAATAYSGILTTVDYQKLDQNFAQVLDGATGEFKNMYSQSSAQLRQLLIDNKAISHGVVVDSAVKSASRDTVDVLIFVDQSVTNSVNPQPRIDRSRISMTMQLVDGRWLASKVDIK